MAFFRIFRGIIFLFPKMSSVVIRLMVWRHPKMSQINSRAPAFHPAITLFLIFQKAVIVLYKNAQKRMFSVAKHSKSSRFFVPLFFVSQSLPLSPNVKNVKLKSKKRTLHFIWLSITMTLGVVGLPQKSQKTALISSFLMKNHLAFFAFFQGFSVRQGCLHLKTRGPQRKSTF